MLYHTLNFSQVREVVGDAGLNMLFNNAGILPKTGGIDETSPEELRNCFETNTIAPLFFAKAMLPLLKAAADKGADKPVGLDRCVSDGLYHSTYNNEQCTYVV